MVLCPSVRLLEGLLLSVVSQWEHGSASGAYHLARKTTRGTRNGCRRGDTLSVPITMKGKVQVQGILVLIWISLIGAQEETFGSI
jgi:hypothetical protein